jgi:RNA polymerase sigma-70 factor (ECF subfamily)
MTPEALRMNVAELLPRIALRDRKAFDQLYETTSRKIFGVCLRILSNRTEAEEAVQEVFIKIWLKADRYAVTEQSPMTWLISIARNQALDQLRRRRENIGALNDAALQVHDPAPGPEVKALESGERCQIDNCLAELDHDRAAAIRSAYLDGESYLELAARFDVPLNTMRTWLRRSLMRLKECLSR